jgi:hypothetical protein
MRSRSAAAKLASMGFEVAPEPGPPDVLEARALHCWSFMGGWHPERLPVYVALHDVDDLAAVMEAVVAIRDAQEADT